MSAFVSKGGKTPKIRVYDRHGTAHVRTSGTREYPELLSQVEAFVKKLRADKRFDVLDAIIARELTACEAFRFNAAERLNAEIAARRAQRIALETEAADIDLSPLVEKLVENAKYRTQIRKLIPAGKRFARSQFTRANISAFIRDLTARQQNSLATRPAKTRTKRNHRAALSVFGEKLVEAGIIELNPVKQVKGPKLTPKDKRITFLTPQETRKLVDSLTPRQRALEALMAGTGMEFQSCDALRKNGIDIANRMVYACGNKTDYRERWVEVTENWAWDILMAHIANLTPESKVFRISESSALKTHQRRCKEFGFKKTTLHQHRHGFATMHIKRGCDHQWLKNQLGHAPESTELYHTYGLYINAKKMTDKQKERMGDSNSRSVTNDATSARNNFNVEGIRVEK